MVYDGKLDKLYAKTRKGSELMFDKMDLVKVHDASHKIPENNTES
jgi:hypothetical protein